MSNIVEPTRRTLLKIGAGVVAVASLPLPSLAQARPKLRIAAAPFLPTQSDTERAWRPMYQFLADAAGFDLDFTVTGDWAAAPVALIAGHADIIMTGTWGVVLAMARGNATPIASSRTAGADTSSAIIIGRKGVDFSDFPDKAKGMSIAFGDSGGLSAWMWPQHYFQKEKGIDPRTYFKYTEGVGTAAIVVSVTEGRTDLGCTWDTLLSQMASAGTIKADSYQVVVRSNPIPNGGLVARAGFDPALAMKIQEALLTITPEKAKALGMPAPYDGWVRADNARFADTVQMGKDLGLLNA